MASYAVGVEQCFVQAFSAILEARGKAREELMEDDDNNDFLTADARILQQDILSQRPQRSQSSERLSSLRSRALKARTGAGSNEEEGSEEPEKFGRLLGC